MPITKKGAAATSKTASKNSAVSMESLDEILSSQSGRRIVNFSLADIKSAVKGKYGKYTLIASDGLPVEYNPKTFTEQFVRNDDGSFTVADGFYANSKGAVWPVE